MPEIEFHIDFHASYGDGQSQMSLFSNLPTEVEDSLYESLKMAFFQALQGVEDE